MNENNNKEIVEVVVEASNTMPEVSMIRTLNVSGAVKQEILTNVLLPLIGEENLTIGESSIAWDMSKLDVVSLKAIEKALIERAKMGFFGDEEAIKVVAQPALNQAMVNDCIYYVAQSNASLDKFINEVLVFANIDRKKQVVLKQPHSLAVMQITMPVVIVTGLTPQEMGKVRSNANWKKWGITGGKIVGNITSGAGLMAHTLFEEAVAPAAVNLSIAGAKITKTAVITSSKIADVVVDEGSKAILEIAESLSDSEGFGKAKERVMAAWAIASKKDPNKAEADVISF